MRRRIIAFLLMVLMVMAYGATASAQATIDDLFDEVEGNASSANLSSGDRPQAFVTCRGWHALCDFASDCTVVGDQANCACWQVQEPYVVESKKIQDPAVKRRTQSVCTASHPCGIDEAPVCRAIRLGQFKVDNVKYRWVSTFSYRGWCENWNPVPCDAAPWADCMSAPCTEIDNPADPERPLSCQCRVMNSAFIGTRGSCEPGTVMSTEPAGNWNFDKGTFTVPYPGYQYVKGACAELGSDDVAPK